MDQPRSAGGRRERSHEVVAIEEILGAEEQLDALSERT
jgi:hypothetical protein